MFRESVVEGIGCSRCARINETSRDAYKRASAEPRPPMATRAFSVSVRESA